MDETGAAIVEAYAPYGIVPLTIVALAVVVVAVACIFILPAWRDKMKSDAETARMKVEAEIKLEQERERRKADEAEKRDEHERERAAIDSKTAVLLEGLKASIDALKSDQDVVTAQIDASRSNSRKMGETVEDTNRTVHAIERAIIGSNR